MQEENESFFDLILEQMKEYQNVLKSVFFFGRIDGLF